MSDSVAIDGTVKDHSELNTNEEKEQVNNQAVTQQKKKTYLEEIDELVAILESEGFNSTQSYEAFMSEYGKENKNRSTIYNSKVIAGAYYKYTKKRDKLDNIDYQRILEDKGDAVVQSNNKDEVKIHAHHICYKRGKKGKVAKKAEEGRKLLEKYGIDPVLDPDNLVAAPNKGHSEENITAVVDALQAAEQAGIDECKDITDPEERKKVIEGKLREALRDQGRIAKNRSKSSSQTKSQKGNQTKGKKGKKNKGK